jgi:hypothetical protein
MEHSSEMNDQYKLMVFIIPDLNEYNSHVWVNFTYEADRNYPVTLKFKDEIHDVNQ